MKVIEGEKIANCRFIGQFDQLDVLGEGTYGTVYRAKDKKSGKEVAIKKMKVHDTQEGFPITSLREVKVLRALAGHPNIVELLQVAVGKNKDSVFLVFEYSEIDMANLLDQSRIEKMKFTEGQIKCLILQVLKGLTYAHRNYIIHRDLKLSNLLLNKQGILKIADFGLARYFQKPEKPLTRKVVTLWYRAPELLMQWSKYGKGVDVWSMGCIVAQLFNQGVPLFQGNTEVHQFQLICQTIGFPTREQWPEFFTETKKQVLKSVQKFSVHRKNNLESIFEKCPRQLIELLGKMLTWNPRSRIDLEQALFHPFFYQPPKACFPDQLRIISKIQQFSKRSVESLSRRRQKDQK